MKGSPYPPPFGFYCRPCQPWKCGLEILRFRRPYSIDRRRHPEMTTRRTAWMRRRRQAR